MQIIVIIEQLRTMNGNSNVVYSHSSMTRFLQNSNGMKMTQISKLNIFKYINWYTILHVLCSRIIVFDILSELLLEKFNANI